MESGASCEEIEVKREELGVKDECHCEERSDEAIRHKNNWIAASPLAFGSEAPRNDNPAPSTPHSPTAKDFSRGAALLGELAVAARRSGEYILYGILSDASAYVENAVLTVATDDEYDIKKLNEKADFFDKILSKHGAAFRAAKHVPEDEPDKEIIERLNSLAGGKLIVSN